MKISQALRLGAKTGKQLFNDAFDNGGGTCAYWAIRKGFDLGNDADGKLVFDLQHYRLIYCPVKGCQLPYTNGGGEKTPTLMPWSPNRLGDVIVHLNNDHKWTRECIAGWIEVAIEGGIPSKEIMELVGEPEKTRELVCVRPHPSVKS